MVTIHETAMVDPAAELDEDVEVGPYSIIGPQVKIGSGTERRAAINDHRAAPKSAISSNSRMATPT